MDATVQLNARMKQSLKQSGDKALASIGYSPSQAVRALWEKASRRGKDLEEVAAILRGDDLSPDETLANQDDVLVSGWALMDEAYRTLGISQDVKHDLPDSKELLEEALHERLVERGLA